MFAKTFRSVVAMVMVCALMIGIGGNAVVQALNVPGTDLVDNRVNTIIGQLNTAIDDLEAQIKNHENTLNDGENKLNEGEAKLLDAEKKLEELRAVLAEAKAALPGYEEELEQARKDLDQARVDLDNAKATLDEKQAEKDAAQATLNDKQAELDAAQAELDAKSLELAEFMNNLPRKYAIVATHNGIKYAMTPDQNAKGNKFLAVEWKNFEYDFEKVYVWDVDFDALMNGVLIIENDDGFVGYNSGTNIGYHPKAYSWLKTEHAENGLRHYVSETNDTRALAFRNDGKGNLTFGAYSTKNITNNYADEYSYQLEIWSTQVIDPATEAKIDEMRNEVDAAQKKLDDAQKQLDDAQTQLDDAYVTWVDYDKQWKDYDKTWQDADKQLTDAKALITEATETEDTVGAEIEEAKKIIADAKIIVEDAKAAIAEAHATIAVARECIANVETTYNELMDAVSNPTASLAFVKGVVADLQTNLTNTWQSVKDLQAALDSLLAAYALLEGKTISYDGFKYDHDEVHYELPNGKVYHYDAIHVTVEAFSYSMPELPAMVEKLENTLDTVIARTISAYNAARYYWLIVRDKIGAENIDLVIETIRDLDRNTAKKIYNWLYNNPERVCNLVKKYGFVALDLLTHYGPYAVDLIEEHHELLIKAVKYAGGAALISLKWLDSKDVVLEYTGKALDFVMQYRDEVAAIAAKLYAKYGDEAKALIEVYVDYLNLRERYQDATNGVYVVGGHNLYAAIGDESATAWAEMLSETLGVEFENLTDSKLSVEESVQKNLETLKKADIITVGYNANNALEHALQNLQDYLGGYGAEDIDWTGLLGERYATAIDNALARFENALINYGYDVTYEFGGETFRAIDLLKLFAETYLYDYITYVLESRRAVNAIHEVNEYALVVLVGMYNPFEGMNLTVQGRSLPLGKAYDALIEAVDAYYLAYAFVNENTIFVNAPYVETNADYNGLSVTEFLNTLLLNGDEADKWDATENGSEYVKDQILDHLEIKQLGDVNHDGVVDNIDALLVLQYTVGLIDENGLDTDVADTTFNHEINNCDALKILQYTVELITDWTETVPCK